MLLSLSDAPKYEALKHSGSQGLYSAVQPDQDTVGWLTDLCYNLDFEDVKPDKFHCTVMYSPKDTPAPESVELQQDTEFPAIAREVTHWEGHDGKTCVVLLLVCVGLHGEHQRLKKLGCTPTYDDYKPHITLQSDVDMNEDLELKIAQVNTELKRDKVAMILNNQIVGDIDP